MTCKNIKLMNDIEKIKEDLVIIRTVVLITFGMHLGTMLAPFLTYFLK